MNAVVMGVRQSFHFGGRMSRGNYVCFVLFSWVFLSAFANIAQLMIDQVGTQDVQGLVFSIAIVLADSALLLCLAIAMVSAGVRRCHDCGWPGWAILIILVPLFGQLVLFGRKGDAEKNRYGPVDNVAWAR